MSDDKDAANVEIDEIRPRSTRPRIRYQGKCKSFSSRSELQSSKNN